MCSDLDTGLNFGTKIIIDLLIPLLNITVNNDTIIGNIILIKSLPEFLAAFFNSLWNYINKNKNMKHNELIMNNTLLTYLCAAATSSSSHTAFSHIIALGSSLALLIKNITSSPFSFVHTNFLGILVGSISGLFSIAFIYSAYISVALASHLKLTNTKSFSC